MRFARRNRFALIFLGVLLVANFMVFRQYQVNASAHSELREDLILLCEKGHSKQAQWTYQKLVQTLPKLPDQALIDELQRTSGVVDEKTMDSDNLVWKYHWAVKRHLEERSEQRVARAIKRAERE
jgi:hypothetical protein